MRKLLTLVLALSLVLTLSACNKDNPDPPSGNEKQTLTSEEVQKSISIVTGTAKIDGVTLPDNHIVISSTIHGELGFDYKQEITANQLSTAGLNAENVKLFYIDNSDITEVKNAITANADGGITVTIRHFSNYVLCDEENPPISAKTMGGELNDGSDNPADEGDSVPPPPPPLDEKDIVKFSVEVMSNAELTEKITNGEIPANVTHLTINGCLALSDLTPLSGLTDLRVLNLIATQITDLSPINKLPYLTELDIWRDETISDISGLSGMTNLTYLGLRSATSLSNISPISTLKNLTELQLTYCQINDVSALGSLTKLETMSLWSNKISDVTALHGLTNLKTLSLGDNEISQQGVSDLAAALTTTYITSDYGEFYPQENSPEETQNEPSAPAVGSPSFADFVQGYEVNDLTSIGVVFEGDLTSSIVSADFSDFNLYRNGTALNVTATVIDYNTYYDSNSNYTHVRIDISPALSQSGTYTGTYNYKGVQFEIRERTI